MFYISEEFEYFVVVVAWFVVENLKEMKAVAIKCGSITLFKKNTLIEPLPAEGIANL